MTDAAPVVPLEEFLSMAGRDLGFGAWRRIDQAAIDAFAELTGDRQFIHVDPEKAAKTPFGGTIAHAFFVLSLLGGAGLERTPRPEGGAVGLNYGFDRVRFTQPVRSGGRVRPHFAVKAVERKAPGRILVTLAVSVEIEGQDKPALVADWLVMVLGA